MFPWWSGRLDFLLWQRLCIYKKTTKYLFCLEIKFVATFFSDHVSLGERTENNNFFYCHLSWLWDLLHMHHMIWNNVIRYLMSCILLNVFHRLITVFWHWFHQEPGHHQLYNSLWVSASCRSVLHSSVLKPLDHHLLIPIFLSFLFTSSSHLLLVFPHSLFQQFQFLWLVNFCFFLNRVQSSLYLFLRAPLPCTGPEILPSIFLSNASGFCSSDRESVQHLYSVVMIGLIRVLVVVEIK